MRQKSHLAIVSKGNGFDNTKKGTPHAHVKHRNNCSRYLCPSCPRSLRRVRHGPAANSGASRMGAFNHFPRFWRSHFLHDEQPRTERVFPMIDLLERNRR
ncbi:hypothetical protein GDI3870 (plasmid) [Gluconacetobacter diazotrophicus PA1 5]|uniref:Uncharacterized protein n=1 Tax=Gluconacetobacter diazotrophicus (strain ATCC 49037 / DSM 5601 / CCUG 37298 / CIP 103539 / LMG 7603 / PAl5) TaxID=272568 RepID=A9HSV0_GLUDA|nr:hypothetical protein GDI3870 [Gluconacetobacter diazotrophicus PA1 5]